jgi:hypothetical protein
MSDGFNGSGALNINIYVIFTAFQLNEYVFHFFKQYLHIVLRIASLHLCFISLYLILTLPATILNFM